MAEAVHGQADHGTTRRRRKSRTHARLGDRLGRRAGALTAFLVLSVAAGPWRDADAILAIVAGMFGVAAMAVQNALVPIALRNTRHRPQ
jgi:hypothetical protein